MSELKKITFKEFVTLQRGFDLPKKNMKPGMYPVIGSTSIIGYHNEFKVDPPGVVTGRSGALGSVQYIPVKYWPHNTSLWIRDFKGNSPRYVYYFLQTLGLGQFNSGAAVPTLNRNDLDSLELKIHNLPTQRKIAVVLSTYDDLIENNTRRIKILEEIASAIYREWFVEFRFPGHEQVPMVESELGLIPHGWEVKKVEEFVVDHIGGGWGKEDNDSKHIVPAYVIRGTDFSEVRHLAIDTCPLRYHTQSNFKSRELKPNDIVMEISGGSKDWGVGRSILVTPQLLSAFNESVICASFCKKLSLDEKTFSPLIFIIYLQEAYKSRNLELYELRSTGIRNFQFPVFLQREQLPVPLFSIQRQFVAQVQPLIDSIQNIGTKNTNLRQTRDLLLPKLISGEIDVSKLDIDTDRIQPKKGGAHIPNSLKDWLHSDENILGGNPVIKGTRLTIAFLLELLECGWSEKEVLENYPNIKREHIDACLAFQQEATRASVSG